MKRFRRGNGSKLGLSIVFAVVIIIIIRSDYRFAQSLASHIMS